MINIDLASGLGNTAYGDSSRSIFFGVDIEAEGLTGCVCVSLGDCEAVFYLGNGIVIDNISRKLSVVGIYDNITLELNGFDRRLLFDFSKSPTLGLDIAVLGSLLGPAATFKAVPDRVRTLGLLTNGDVRGEVADADFYTLFAVNPLVQGDQSTVKLCFAADSITAAVNHERSRNADADNQA